MFRPSYFLFLFSVFLPNHSSQTPHVSSLTSTTSSSSTSSSDDTLWIYSFVALTIALVLLIITLIVKGCHKCVEEERTSTRGRLRAGSKRDSAGVELPPPQTGTGYYNEGGQGYYGKGSELQRKGDGQAGYYQQQGGYQNYDYKYGQNPNPNVNPLEQRYLENRYPDAKKDPYALAKIWGRN